MIGTWHLDPRATTIALRTKAMWGLVTVNGSLRATEGSAVVSEDGSVTGTFVVDAASINTAQAKRDAHLRSKEFFDVEHHPTFAYAVTSAILGAGATVAIRGTFTVRGQTHPLPVHGTLTSTDATTSTLTIQADLNRTHWGLDWTKMGARVDNHITIVAVFTRSTAPINPATST